MSVEIVMPKLSDTMEEGTILKWLKHVGDAVARGEVLAEVETDKADMELEADTEGVLHEIKVQEGESAHVGAVIALLEQGAAVVPTSMRPAQASRPTAPREKVSSTQAATTATAPSGDGKATPAARKLAGERGVDLRAVQGSGPGGRIVTDDVPAAATARAETQARATETDRHDAAARDTETDRDDAAARNTGSDGGDVPADEDAGHAPLVQRQELSRMRQSIARRMSEAFREIPHFYVTAEIDMSEAARLKDALQRNHLFEPAITYTHMVLKATALALKRHPRLNASYRDGAIELKGEVNLGMAVAVEDGLIVPVLRRVDEMSLADVAAAARRLVEQARRGRFGRDELSGGTFTVSNMGMLDLEDFAAVINPPQAAILAVGSIKERAVVRDGVVMPRRTMRVTVSCDHRIIDGVVAGRFLEELKRLLENPIILVVRE